MQKRSLFLVGLFLLPGSFFAQEVIPTVTSSPSQSNGCELIVVTRTPIGNYNADFQNVKGFYETVSKVAKLSFPISIDASETIIMAQKEQAIIGCCRLVTDHHCLMVRSMHVLAPYRRTGIGSHMLIELNKAVSGRECFLSCWSYLETFWQRAGFYKMEPSKSPLFLQEDLAVYLRDKKDVIIMKKDRLPS